MGRAIAGRQIRGVTDQADFDVGTWPKPDVGALSRDMKAAYLSRELAVEMCFAGESDKSIKGACGIGLKQVTRLIKERCMALHEDGQIYGFRGLVKHVRINEYTRTKPVALDVFGRGGSGALKSLLELDPGFRKALDKQILSTAPKKDVLGEIKRPRMVLWGWFLTELRARGYEMRKDWPFGRDREMPDGYGALNRYSDALLKEHPRLLARVAAAPRRSKQERRDADALVKAERQRAVLDGMSAPVIRLSDDGRWRVEGTRTFPANADIRIARLCRGSGPASKFGIGIDPRSTADPEAPWYLRSLSYPVCVTAEDIQSGISKLKIAVNAYVRTFASA
jgi:hypothetical protein